MFCLKRSVYLMEATNSVLLTDFSAKDDLAVLLLFTIEKIEEQTKMEKNKATKYMPTQKKKEFQPPMAERVDLGFMDITLVFQKDAGQGCFFYRKLHKQGIVKIKNSP
jgi:hypothetical protein